MKQITLTSDWNTKEPYLALFKGQLAAQIPAALLLDLTHTVDTGGVNQAAFFIQHSYPHFALGTVHICLVGVTASLDSDLYVVHYDGQYFIAADDKVLALVVYPNMSAGLVRRYVGEARNYWEKITDLCAACLSGTCDAVTEVAPQVSRVMPFEANVIQSQQMIIGGVMHIDAQNNLITNVPVEMFHKYVGDRKFRATIGQFEITRYHEHYVSDDDAYFIPNVLGVMEVTVYMGKLSLLAPWNKDAPVNIWYGLYH